MNWRRIRFVASGALITGSLLAGATVGSAVLLGSADHRGDPVGRLSAHLVSRDATAARGARAEAGQSATARGAHASPAPPPASPQPPPPPPPAPAPAPAPAPDTGSAVREDTTGAARTTRVETEKHAAEPEHRDGREGDGEREPDD